MKIVVLGGGAQGSACALDLVERGDVERVTLADLDVSRPARFLEPYVGGERLALVSVDARDERALRALMQGADAVACALPFYFNAAATRAAIDARAHFCDLGGNTAIVNEQMALTAEAERAGVSVVPDCGLAPGMVNILAQGGIDALDETDAVRIFVGGLPRHPKPPLGYRIAYSLEGVLDYYTTPVLVLEDGKVAEKKALTAVEMVPFPEPLGGLEAFLTAGGISRMPYRYEGRIRSMTYKTLRYPGHAAIMRAIRDLGLLDRSPVDLDGCDVSPRALFMQVAGPRLTDPDGADLVALRVVVSGRKAGVTAAIQYDLVDHNDAERGVSAMMRTTGYSLAAIARMQASGQVVAGVHTPDECIPATAFISELAERGIEIERSARSAAGD